MKKGGIFYGYVVMAAAFLIMLVMWGTYYSYGVFFSPLLEEFGWTRATVSGAFSLSFVLSGLTGIIAGKLNDRFGPRMVMTVCGILLGTGYLLSSQITSVWQLYLYYGIVVGLGMSGSFPPVVSTIARWFVRRRGMMTGITISSVGTGILVIPPLAQLAISSNGWRYTYVGMGVITVVAVVLIAQWLRYDPRQVGQLPYGESETATKGNIQQSGFTLPVAMHSPQFWMIAIVLLGYGVFTGTVQVHVVPHTIGLGISAGSAAVVLAISGGAGMAGRIIMGGIGDRVGIRRAFLISLSFVAISLFWLLWARELWMLYLFAVIFGFGAGGMASLISPTVAEEFGLSSHGAILGTVMFSATAGSAFGPVIAGHVFDITKSYGLAFLLAAVSSVVAFVLIFLLKPTKGVAENRTGKSVRSH